MRETFEYETKPSLAALLDGLEGRLELAVTKSTQLLDELPSAGEGGVFVTVDLQIKGKVLSSPAEIDALLDETRHRLLVQLQRWGQKPGCA